MISSASHDNVSRLVADRSMCFATVLDKAFEKIDCMIAILSCQAKNRFYESTQRLIQPRRVLWIRPEKFERRLVIGWRKHLRRCRQFCNETSVWAACRHRPISELIATETFK